MKFFVLWIFLFLGLAAEARVQVLFHPYEPTLEEIAKSIAAAQATVDIAMYNLDTTDNSPVIQTLKSADVQKRIQSGELRLRMVLELYGEPAANEKKRQAVEDLGVDVRYLDAGVKVHHKFAVIDAEGPGDQVITGSANWSMGSYRNYDENILFFTHEPEVTSWYQFEFNRLWQASKEFGVSRNYPEVKVPDAEDQAEVEVYFNTAKTLTPGSGESSYLTGELVRLINGAKFQLQIASTRVRLVPVLEALLAAAQRGVKVQVVISQDDFRFIGPRAKYLLAHPNIELRVKLYNLKLDAYIAFQMHNKYMIVDGETIFTGSFNWSESSENNHIENVVVLKGAVAAQVLPDYQREFAMIWEMGRDKYPGTLQALQQGTHSQCALPKMVLTAKEIRALLKFAAGCLKP